MVYKNKLYMSSLSLPPSTPALPYTTWLLTPCLSGKCGKKVVGCHFYFLILFAWFEGSDDPERLFADKRFLAQ